MTSLDGIDGRSSQMLLREYKRLEEIVWIGDLYDGVILLHYDQDPAGFRFLVCKLELLLFKPHWGYQI